MIRTKEYYAFKTRSVKTVYGEDVVHLNYTPLKECGEVSEFPLNGNVFITGNRPLEKKWSLSGNCADKNKKKDNNFHKAHLKTFNLPKESLERLIFELLDNKFDIHPNHFKFFGLDLNKTLNK